MPELAAPPHLRAPCWQARAPRTPATTPPPRRPRHNAPATTPPPWAPRAGAAYPGSELEAALSHLAAAHAAVKRGDALGQAAWQQVADDLVCVGQAVQRRQQADEGVAASPSRVAQQAFARLARLPRAGGGG